MTIGENITNRRKQLGLSMGKLAECAEVSRSYLHEIEHTGKSEVTHRAPSVQVTYRLARALGCSMEDLIGMPPLGSIGDEAMKSVALENAALKSKLRRIAAIASKE